MRKNIILIIVIISCNYLSIAQSTTAGAKEETNIYERVYDAQLYLTDNQQLSLPTLYSEKPILLALVFTRCSGICNPFLLRLKENLQFKEDNSFNILITSFDPRDNRKDMERMAKSFGLENNEQWIFAVTDSITQLTQSVGFYPTWDSLRNQFDHDALLVGINSEGYITKKLIGIRQGHDLDLLIASINNIFSPTYRLPNKNLLFSCFNYDPKTGKNKLGLGLLFIALPAVLTLILLFSISYFVRDRTPEIEKTF